MGGVYNKGMEALANGGLDWDSGAITVRAMLVTSGYTFNKDHSFVNDASGPDSNELSGTGYARKTLTTRAVVKQNATDRIQCTADTLTWTGINAGTAAAVVVYLQVGGDDTTPGNDVLISCNAITPAVTNGGDLTITWDADGVFYLQQ